MLDISWSTTLYNPVPSAANDIDTRVGSAVHKAAAWTQIHLLYCEQLECLNVPSPWTMTSFLPRVSYAQRGICRRRVSVRLCVCACVSLSHSGIVSKWLNTNHARITQITPHDSPLTSFLTPKFIAKFERDYPLRGRQMQVGCVKMCHFRRKTHYNSKTVQDRHIVSIKVE